MDHSNYFLQGVGLKVDMMKIQLVVEEHHSLIVAVVWLQELVVDGIVKLVVVGD